MDPYTAKLTEMRGYVPFLNKMINKLEVAGDPSKYDQVSILPISCAAKIFLHNFYAQIQDKILSKNDKYVLVEILGFKNHNYVIKTIETCNFI
jgi:predicted nuclease of restriction endonuclease-like RecB superfamily